MKRRNFLELVGGASGLGLAAPLLFSSNSATGANERQIARKNKAECAADLVIAGAGLGGCASALAALRNGFRVILTEETDWIGGQLTQQGVPPDEHQWIETHGATQLYRKFRTAIRDYYIRNYPLTEQARSRKFRNALAQVNIETLLISFENRYKTTKNKYSQMKNSIGVLLICLSIVSCSPSRQLPHSTKVATLSVPADSRYARTVLVQGLDEPLEMAILPNNDVLIVERKGAVKMFDSRTKQLKTIANFHVFSGIEDGLLGMATDPKFSENHWVYFYYARAGDLSVNRLSRFELLGDSLAQSSEKVLLEIPTQRQYCCHSAGYISFDSKGLHYLSTGDNTNAEEPEGYTPVDERPERVSGG